MPAADPGRRIGRSTFSHPWIGDFPTTLDAKTPRREFLRRSGATAVAGGLGYAFPMIVDRRVLGGADVPPPSERVRVGMIGVGGQGTANLKGLQKEKGAEVVAVCDVDKDHLTKAQALAGATGRPIGTFADYRALLDDKSIDAVLIATPDHWHALPICDVAIGHRSATVCHLGNIAIRAGRKLTWDPKAQAIVGDPEAAAMLARPHRAPYDRLAQGGRQDPGDRPKLKRQGLAGAKKRPPGPGAGPRRTSLGRVVRFRIARRAGGRL